MTQPLWTSAAMAQATGGIVAAPFTVTGVSIDTRTLQAGDLFVALKGDALDGHDYVAKAFAAGAAAAMVRKDYAPPDAAWPLLFVDDTLAGMENLARAARARSRGVIIGVAGSVGKTSTKEMLAAICAAAGKTHASKKSFNNHWGVPLTLSGLPEDAAFGVFEMGMNHAGEIARLTEQVRPHIAIITTIDQEHIEFFDNGLEGIADANAEIFSGMDAESTAVLNIDNPYYQRLAAAAARHGVTKLIPFGEDEGAAARLLDCTLSSDGSKIHVDICGQKLRLRLPVAGKHVVMNALGALAVAKAAGIDLDTAAAVLEKLAPVEGRGNRHRITLPAGGPAVTVIDDSYNANPASMLAAFGVLEMTAPAEGGRRIAVLGDMLELGPTGPQLHAGLANPLLKSKAELLFCCGPLMGALYEALPPPWQGAHTKDSRALCDLLLPALKPGDVVLVKGSAGSKMAYIIDALLRAGAAEERKNAV